jgi:phosphoglycolate phosphatase-like HAD superfamily hydrolase
MNRLVLFDIDETLIKPRGVGRRALSRSLVQIFGHELDTSAVFFSGKTDPQLVQEILIANKIGESEFQPTWMKVSEIYPQILKEEIANTNDYSLLSGAQELVLALAERPQASLGLLTGNTELGARIKLEPFQLNAHFPIGAYGSDSQNRMHLPEIAYNRAKAHFARDWQRGEIVIIGDSVNDIFCAQGFLARSIIVNTGRTTWDALAELKPDFLFTSLEPTASLLEAVFA